MKSTPGADGLGQTCLGDGQSFGELRVSPRRRRDNLTQDLAGAPDVYVAEIERGKSHAKKVGIAEIAYYVTRGQCLADGVSVRVAEADMTASGFGGARGDAFEAQRVAHSCKNVKQRHALRHTA
jgi:hypothetical protein